MFGSDEVSLRDALRAGADRSALVDVIAHAVRRKRAKLGGHASPREIRDAAANGGNRAMIRIGG